MGGRGEREPIVFSLKIPYHIFGHTYTMPNSNPARIKPVYKNGWVRSISFMGMAAISQHLRRVTK